MLIVAAVIVSCSNPLNEKFDEETFLPKIAEFQKEEHITKDDKFRFEKYYQLHNKKSISLSGRTYKQILEDPEIAISAISSYTKQKKHSIAKQLLETTKELFDTKDWDYYAESILLDENILNIIQISKSKPTQFDSRNKGDILQKAIASSSPKWSTDTRQEGYVTNLSTTLTLNVKIKVTFTIEKVTKVSLMFLSKTVKKTVYDSKEIIIDNLKPGESKPFKASGSAKQDYYEGIGGTSAKITDIKVEAILISPKFNIQVPKKNIDKFNGYEKTTNGLTYKFYYRGNSSVLPKIGDYLTINLIYATEDSVLFDSKSLSDLFIMPMIEPTFEGDLYDCLSMMSIGDSATFICDANLTYTKLFKMNEVPPELIGIDYLYFNIKLNDIKSSEEYKESKKAKGVNLKDNEVKLINTYIEDNYSDYNPTASGLYYIELKKGKGNIPLKGQTVSVLYKGMFLDGKDLDSSLDQNKPFKFTLGQGQVIKGWDEGIGIMRKGGKAILVIPSGIAYGSKRRGSIPAYSTLVYEVELLDIN